MAENKEKDCKCDEKEKDCCCNHEHEDHKKNDKCECGCGCEHGEKKEETKEEVKEEKKVNEFEDKYKRLLAEFENFRKRNETEKLQMFEIGISSVLTKILPVVDNFERALASVPEELKGNNFVEGVDKTYKQILKVFEELEVKPIEAKGKPFDAKFHNAVMTDENAEGEVDTVVEEMQKGWMYKDQVLRYAMVKVKK